MASPQKENGYIPIANELAEAFAKIHLNGREWQVIWVIIRKTYGWGKKKAQISLSEISKLTGINRKNVWKTISSLIKKNIIKKVKSIPAIYSLQKNYEKWDRGVFKNEDSVFKIEDSLSIKSNNIKDLNNESIVKNNNRSVFKIEDRGVFKNEDSNPSKSRVPVRENNPLKTSIKKNNNIIINNNGEVKKSTSPVFKNLSLKKNKKDPYLLSFFGKVYFRKLGIEYHCSFKKDTELMKKLLKQFPARLVRKLIILYIYTATDFDIKVGLTIGLFYSKWNSLHLEYKRKREKFEKIRKRKKLEIEREKMKKQEEEKREKEFKQQWEKMSMLEKIKYIKTLERWNLPVPEWMKKEKENGKIDN